MGAVEIGESINSGEYKVKLKEDLTGKKFGRLTVINREPDKYRIKKNGRIEYYAVWHCVCDCENKTEKNIDDYSLRSGRIKSCGCLKKIGYNNKNNKYDLSGEYGIGYTTNGEEFYFDIDDYDKIKQYCWRISAYDYVVAYKKGSGRNAPETIQMQWLIMNVLHEDHVRNIVDHKNGMRNDNRKENLRIVNRTQNNMNRKIQKNNTSGRTGVFWSNTNNRWVAFIMKYNKRYYLGSYSNFEDAVKARKEAEEKYFGEYSYDNSRNKAVTQ